MSGNYDLRSALADALPVAGPTRAAVKAMGDIGFKADPKNNDMKELFVGLDLAADGTSSSGAGAAGTGAAAAAAAVTSATTAGASGEGGGSATRRMGAGGPSAAQVLLDYRREKKAEQEAAHQEAAKLLAEGKGPGTLAAAAATIGGVGLARAAGVAGLDMEEAADDERHLRKKNLSKTAARMSSKQKRRRKEGKHHGSDYEDKYTGKVMNKSKRKGRMLAMKQMY